MMRPGDLATHMGVPTVWNAEGWIRQPPVHNEPFLVLSAQEKIGQHRVIGDIMHAGSAKLARGSDR